MVSALLPIVAVRYARRLRQPICWHVPDMAGEIYGLPPRCVSGLKEPTRCIARLLLFSGAAANGRDVGQVRLIADLSGAGGPDVAGPAPVSTYAGRR